jgi:hypothetical protein
MADPLLLRACSADASAVHCVIACLKHAALYHTNGLQRRILLRTAWELKNSLATPSQRQTDPGKDYRNPDVDGLSAGDVESGVISPSRAQTPVSSAA